MTTEMNEGLVDLEVRGGGEHIALELLRDVAAVHAGGGAPIADLGPSFLGVGRWRDHDQPRHANWYPDHNGPRDPDRHPDHNGPRDPDRHPNHGDMDSGRAGQFTRSDGRGPDSGEHRLDARSDHPNGNGNAEARTEARHISDQHDVGERSVGGQDIRAGHAAVDYGQHHNATVNGEQGSGIEHRGEQPHVLSAGARGPANDHHSMSVQPGTAAPYSAGTVSSGFAGLATGGSAGLTPSFGPALSEPVNAAAGPASAAAAATTIATSGSAVPSQPVTTTPMSSAVKAPATSQPLTTTVAHSSTMGTGFAPHADVGAPSSSPADIAPTVSASPRSTSSGQPVVHNAGSGTAAGTSWTGASSPAPGHPAAMGTTVAGTSGGQAPTPDFGGSTTKGSDVHHSGDGGALRSVDTGTPTGATAPAAAPNTPHNAGTQPVHGHATQSLSASNATAAAHPAPVTTAAHPTPATAPSTATGAATSAPTASTAPTAPHPAPATSTPAVSATSSHPTSASTDSTGASLTPHPDTTSVGTVAPTDSAHPGLSSTSDGLSSGLTPSTTAPDSGIQHPTTDHVTLTHH